MGVSLERASALKRYAVPVPLVHASPRQFHRGREDCRETGRGRERAGGGEVGREGGREGTERRL